LTPVAVSREVPPVICAKPKLFVLALALVALQARADHDPEPLPDRAKSLEKIARTMDDLAKRLKDASVGDETQQLQKRVLAQLGAALRREKARAAKAPKGQIDVAAGLERVRAMQERLNPNVKRVARLGGSKERDIMLQELSQYQAKAAQMLRDVAAQCKRKKP
jgi:hypothetical protein